MSEEPFLLAIASHKGGTGRTTAACALAWLWGRTGLRVTLADADPVRAAGLIALDSVGNCPWENVRYADGLPDPGHQLLDADLVIVDCASLMDSTVHEVLGRCHGVVLTCVADPLSLRTVPAAARSLATARVANPKLELLGVMIGLYNDADIIQAPMLGRLRKMHGELLIEPPVPYDPAIRDWALAPGSDLPAGPGSRAFSAGRDRIADLVWRTHRIELAADRHAGRV